MLFVDHVIRVNFTKELQGKYSMIEKFEGSTVAQW